MDVSDFNKELPLQKNPNKLGIFDWGKSGSDGVNEFQIFYVSTYNNLMDNIELKYGREFDSIRDIKIKKCR